MSSYYQKKKDLLAQCLALSEDLISGLEEWDEIPEIMERKEALILQLKALEDSTDDEVKSALSPSQKQELNQSIKLILDLDQNTVERVRKEQQEIKSSLKVTVNEQKVMQYAQFSEIANGRKLDYKK